MMRRLAPVFCSVLFLIILSSTKASAQAADARIHVAAAKAAAYEPGQDFTLIYELCAEPKPGGSVAPPAATPVAAAASPKVPPRSEWYTDPVKVFDNLYYVGGSRKNNMNIWAVTTSEGLILIDAGYDYSVEELVINGLKKMGLDPAQIKYAIMTEAKPQIYGGSKLLQDRYKTHVLLSEADWDVMARSNVPKTLQPKKDMVVTDGQKLTLGDVTVTLYVTPGHTPGTVSMLVSPLKDGSQRHVGSVFGGRGAGDQITDGVQYYRTPVESMRLWSASAKRYKGIAESAGADVFLAAHDNWDKTLDKLNALNFRKPGGPHPFVSKTAVGRYQTVISECMDAQLAWRSGK